MPITRRLLIASNRLPFTVDLTADHVQLRPTCGGLASALGGVHRRGTHLWFGWPGNAQPVCARTRAWRDAALSHHRIVPVDLTAAEHDAYYEGVCNGVLWPVLHTMVDTLAPDIGSLSAYRAVNERFARALLREYREGDIVWIHDYHLLLTPLLLRKHLPDAPIGFFLHTPFPAPDVFRVLPWRQELIEGVLGSSLIGFQTEGDRQNFEEAVRTLVPRAAAQGAGGQGRTRFGTFPIGLDPARLAGPLEGGGAAAGGRRVLLGVDRLDYTKGIPRRLLAFERLLEDHPDCRETTELIQVAVPSRTHVAEYGALKEAVEKQVAHVNARYGTPGWTPIRYVPEALGPSALAALYRDADVMLVTSLRDGMNLVAKEFVMARENEPGVLILSEFAGASEELTEALIVNPYSVSEMAAAMVRALAMPHAERQSRMHALRAQVGRNTVETWLNRYLGQLLASSRPSRPSCTDIGSYREERSATMFARSAT
jgi:trehalose 6-phosphate synthase/phosphatase